MLEEMKQEYEKWVYTPYEGPLWNFKDATWNAWEAAWNACADSLYAAYCDDLAYHKDRLEKEYYEKGETLKQKYAIIELENKKLVEMICERNSLEMSQPIILKKDG